MELLELTREIKMFRMSPTYIIEKVTDMNLEDLKNEGIEGFLFDLDNTLMAPKTGALQQEIVDWLKVVKQDFRIAIVSNNKKEKYIKEAAELVGCPGYAAAAKPRRGAAIEALKEIDLLPSQVAVVGDRPLTDILLGQRLGLTTILVDPLIKHEEILIVKGLRKLERIFIKTPQKVFSHMIEK